LIEERSQVQCRTATSLNFIQVQRCSIPRQNGRALNSVHTINRTLVDFIRVHPWLKMQAGAIKERKTMNESEKTERKEKAPSSFVRLTIQAHERDATACCDCERRDTKMR
jgi:hypothetical protein